MAIGQISSSSPSSEHPFPVSGFRPFQYNNLNGAQQGGGGFGVTKIETQSPALDLNGGFQPQTTSYSFCEAPVERQESGVRKEYGGVAATNSSLASNWRDLQAAAAGMIGSGGSVDAVKQTANQILLEEALRQHQRQQQQQQMMRTTSSDTSMLNISRGLATPNPPSNSSPDSYMQFVSRGMEKPVPSRRSNVPPSVCKICNVAFGSNQVLEAHLVSAHQVQNRHISGLPSSAPTSPLSRKRAFAGMSLYNEISASDVSGGPFKNLSREEASQLSVLEHILSEVRQDPNNNHSLRRENLSPEQMLYLCQQQAFQQQQQQQQHQQQSLAKQLGLLQQHAANAGGALSPHSPLSVLFAAEFAFRTPPESPDTHPLLGLGSAAGGGRVGLEGAAARQTAMAWEMLTRSAINNAALDRTTSAPSAMLDRLQNPTAVGPESNCRGPTPAFEFGQQLSPQQAANGQVSSFGRGTGVAVNPVWGGAPNLPDGGSVFGGFPVSHVGPTLGDIRRTLSDPSLLGPDYSHLQAGAGGRAGAGRPSQPLSPAIPEHEQRRLRAGTGFQWPPPPCGCDCIRAVGSVCASSGENQGAIG